MKQHKMTVKDWLSALDKQDIFRVDLTLDRMRAAIDALGLKSSNIAKKKIITVAGTNGKGTTVTLLTHLLKLNGEKVGMFMSPHLFKFNERIQVNLEPISDQDLVQTFNDIQDFLYDYQLTYFEFVTLAAFKFFAGQDLDYVVLEIGLGGRLDAVNAIDNDLAIITNIELDHTKWLGDTREKIGFEKAGIIREKTPIIFSHEDMPESIRRVASEQQATLHQYGTHFKLDMTDTYEWVYDNGLVAQTIPESPYDKHQVASVLEAYYLLKGCLPETLHFDLPDNQLLGRRQCIEKQDRTYMFDVAHNEASVIMLVEKIISLNIKGRVRMIFSALMDKDIQQMVAQLKPYIDEWFLVQLENSRAVPIDTLVATMQANQVQSYQVSADAPQAFKQAEDLMDSGDLLIVAGSFYLLANLQNEVKQCAL